MTATQEMLNDFECEEQMMDKKLQQKIDKEIVELNDTLDFISPYQR
jgi:hypothetical protein